MHDHFDWLTALKKQQISLADALHFYLQESNAPPLLTMLYEQVLDQYQTDKKSDFAELMGVKTSDQERINMETATWNSHVKSTVDDFYTPACPKSMPDKEQERTAFDKAANAVNLSPTRVFDIYYERDSHKKRLKKKRE